MFEAVYAAGRHASRGRLRTTRPPTHNRAIWIGLIPVLLLVRLYVIDDNAKSWCYETGWKAVERLAHGRVRVSLRRRSNGELNPARFADDVRFAFDALWRGCNK